MNFLNLSLSLSLSLSHTHTHTRLLHPLQMNGNTTSLSVWRGEGSLFYFVMRLIEFDIRYLMGVYFGNNYCVCVCVCVCVRNELTAGRLVFLCWQIVCGWSRRVQTGHSNLTCLQCVVQRSDYQ